METVQRTICSMCTSGFCPTDVRVEDGRAVAVDIGAVPCPRGKAQLEFVYHPDRLRRPLRRTGPRGTGQFAPVSWDLALGDIAAQLLKIRHRYGAESVVFFVGYTQEPRPYVQRLAHAFGSPNYVTESSCCFLATTLAAAATYGPAWRYFHYSGALHPATRLHMLWSANPPVSSPPTVANLWEAQGRGTRLIVVDPRRTETARRADMHLQLRPGTDGALALALIHVIVAEGLYDHAFVKDWTVGFDSLVRLVEAFPPRRGQAITGVPADQIRETARLLARIKPAKIQFSASATVHAANGVQNHRAIILLPALTGNLDVPGGNMLPFDQPPPLRDISLRERLASLPPRIGTERFPFWSQVTDEGQLAGLADQIVSGRPYPIKALIGIGANVMMFADSARMREAWTQLDLLVFTDFFPTPTTDLGDYVLPAATYMEGPALVTGPPFSPQAARVRYREAVLEPWGESRPDWWILFELAARLGLRDMFWQGDFERSVADILSPSGIDLAELRRHPEGLPLPTRPHEPWGYRHTGFDTPSGKVEIRSSLLEACGYEGLPVYREPTESPRRPALAADYPLVLTTGARVPVYTHSQFRRVTSLQRQLPEPQLEVNPADASLRGIATGEQVVLSTLRGRIVVRAEVTDVVPPGVVQMGHGWPQADVNLLTDGVQVDPISGFPAFKSLLCQVSRM